MLLSIENFLFSEKFGEDAAFKMIKKAGFDAVDYSLNATGHRAIDLENHLEKAAVTKKLLEENGLLCTGAHAPFVLRHDEELSVDNKNFLDVVRSIEYAAVLGAGSIVIHALNVPSGVDFFEVNYNYYKALEPYAKNAGIKIAVENLVGSKFWTPQKLCRFIEDLDSPVFCACVDVGHAAITGVEPENYIKGMEKGVLEWIHLHDTDGNVDRHWIPYQGCHNWDKIIKALADYGYNGDMNLEIIHSFDNLPDELYAPMLNYCGEVGKLLIKKFEYYKMNKV